MKIVGPIYRVSYSSGEPQATERIAGTHFRLDHRRVAGFFGRQPSPLLDDLLRIAMSVYVVDRAVKRRLKANGRAWSRTIRMMVGINEPDFWNSSEIKSALTETLDFLGGDCWEIEF